MFTDPNEARDYFYKHGRIEDRWISIKLLKACAGAYRPVEFEANHAIAKMEEEFVLKMANQLKEQTT